jgi:hypothetical protein
VRRDLNPKHGALTVRIITRRLSHSASEVNSRLDARGERKEARQLLHAALAAAEPSSSASPLRFGNAEMIREARDFVAAEVPFGALAEALRTADSGDPSGELQLIMRELFALEEQTAKAADMIERSSRELPELADLLNAGLRRPVLDALTKYLDSRAETGKLRATPDTAATARLVLETLTWFARHRHSDPYGAAIPPDLARETAIDALLHALVPPQYLAAERLERP